jgi:hypothetical protein
MELRFTVDALAGLPSGVDEWMVAQIGFEFGSRQRLGIEIALRFLTFMVQEERRLGVRLDALRDHFEAEIVRHRDE